MKINKTSQDVRYKIRKKSVLSLPNNPSEAGMKPDDIKKAFVAPIIDTKDSVLAELDRIVGETNDALSGVDKKINKVDNTSDAEKPVSAAQQAALDGKVDKITTDGKTSVVYGVTSAGKNTAFEMTADKWKYSVPFRNNDRTFEIGDPVKDSNPVTLAYLRGVVDGLVGKAGNQMIDGSLSIKGDLFIEGSTYGTDVESLNVKDAVIVANADGVPLAELSGYVIRVSDEQAYGILYDPAEGCVKIGLGAFDGNVFTYGEEEAQVLATRDRIEGGNFPVWDSEHHTFVDSGKCVSDFMSKKDFNTYNENIEAALDEIIEIQEALINQYREESE